MNIGPLASSASGTVAEREYRSRLVLAAPPTPLVGYTHRRTTKSSPVASQNGLRPAAAACPRVADRAQDRALQTAQQAPTGLLLEEQERVRSCQHEGVVVRLTDQALSELSEQLSRAASGSDCVGSLLNGDPAVALAPLGLRLPAEALQWFSWCWPARWVTPMFEVLTLTQAVDLTAGLRRDAEAISRSHDVATPAADIFSPTWLAIGVTGGREEMVIDCDDPVLAPMYLHSFEAADTCDTPPRFGSMGEFVTTWIAGLRSGATIYKGAGDWRITDAQFARRVGMAVSPPPGYIEAEIRAVRAGLKPGDDGYPIWDRR